MSSRFVQCTGDGLGNYFQTRDFDSNRRSQLMALRIYDYAEMLRPHFWFWLWQPHCRRAAPWLQTFSGLAGRPATPTPRIGQVACFQDQAIMPSIITALTMLCRSTAVML